MKKPFEDPVGSAALTQRELGQIREMQQRGGMQRKEVGQMETRIVEERRQVLEEKGVC